MRQIPGAFPAWGDRVRRRLGVQVVMFTSDVSARGVDYPDVTLVVQVCHCTCHILFAAPSHDRLRLQQQLRVGRSCAVAWQLPIRCLQPAFSSSKGPVKCLGTTAIMSRPLSCGEHLLKVGTYELRILPVSPFRTSNRCAMLCTLWGVHRSSHGFPAGK